MFEIIKRRNLYFSLSKEAFDLYSKSFFGEIKENKVVYMPCEVLYLVNKNKAYIKEEKRLKKEEIIKKMKERDLLEYMVYSDLRNKGYILKSGKKFGGDFIVYEKGKKPGKDHSRWILKIVEGKRINVDDLLAKARIATSTNKILLVCFLEENKNLYYEIVWKKM
jgi:tRNA-intron endonuclease